MDIKRQISSRLQWKLFFPLIGMLWLIIGITIGYFVTHEKQRQKENLVNRLLNVNNTVIDAYDRGVDLQETVDFIRLFTDNTTLAPLRITVYNAEGEMIADNPAATINIYEADGKPNASLVKLMSLEEDSHVTDMSYEADLNMISAKRSHDGRICSLAALPYEGEVLTFLSIDPMVWVVVVILGILTSLLAYLGVRAVCRNVYVLRDFAVAIADDRINEDVDTDKFSNDELGEVSRQLVNIYRKKIKAQQEKIKHERQIGLNINHELNTPVGIIKGYIDTIINTPDMDDDTKKHFLLRIQQNTDRLSSIVHDISMVMRLTDNGEIKETTIINIHEVVKHIAEDIAQTNAADGMSFRYEIPKNCMVSGHESLLTNAILNLINNAIKYSGGSEMLLKWEGEKNGRQIFTFADNGTGVNEEHLDRLFDLFYRVDYGRSRKKGGAGLGLPLVKRIITAFHGDIKVENAPTGGLRFTFQLPAPRS